jgi:hypothetical protein
MRTLGSRRVVLVTATGAFLLFLARSWIDWRFVFPEFMADTDVGTAFAALAFYVGVSAAWTWTLVAIGREQRGGPAGALLLAALLLVIGGIATLVSLCPSPCGTAWPLMEVANWLGIVTGGLSVLSAGARTVVRD